jgi:hypothetical protein
MVFKMHNVKQNSQSFHQFYISLSYALSMILLLWSGKSQNSWFPSHLRLIWVNSWLCEETAESLRIRSIDTTFAVFYNIKAQVHIMDTMKRRFLTLSASSAHLHLEVIDWFQDRTQRWYQFNDELVTEIDSLLPVAKTLPKSNQPGSQQSAKLV